MFAMPPHPPYKRKKGQTHSARTSLVASTNEGFQHRAWGWGEEQGSGISQERPAVSGDSARGMEASLDGARGRGAPEAETPRGLAEGPGPDPGSCIAKLRPHCLQEVASSPLLPHPPNYPSIAPHRPQPLTPTPTRPLRRPLQAAVEDTGQAASPGDGGGGSGAALSRGRTAAGPRPVPRGSRRRAASGQRLRPLRTKRPRRAGRRAGGGRRRAGGTTHRRAGGRRLA